MSSDENELKKLSVRELRTKAVKALGSKLAAGLKLKQELVDALVAKVKKAAPAKKAESKKPEPKKSPPKRAAAAAKKAESKKPEPKKAEPKKKATPVKTAAVKRKAEPASEASTPPRMTKPPKAEAAAEVYELPITRDFFVDPRRPSLPASYGDDRLLCFRREPLAIVVSWDLSAATFEDGHGLALELVTLEGRLHGSVPVTAATGLATFDALPEGKALAVQVVRRGRVMTRGRPFILGTPKDGGAAGAGAWQMTVPLDQPLPEAPERREWADAPAPVVSARAKARASSSRLSS